MKGFKRVLSVILCAVILFGSIPFAEVTDTNYHYASAATASSYSQGDIIEFGSYPQSKVTDESLISVLNSAGGKWISYKYYSGSGGPYYGAGSMASSDFMFYKDVVYGEEKYRGVVFYFYRPSVTGYPLDNTTFPSYNNEYFYARYSNQAKFGYYVNCVYWFKYEPIKWRVLDPDTGMIMADSIIDSQAFNNYVSASDTDGDGKLDTHWGTSGYANNYANSSIREWLNYDFYNTAFSTKQQYRIKQTTLDNSAYSDSCSEYDSVSTTDKVYLLSYDDVLNSSYGFKNNPDVYDSIRKTKSSDYAKCQGVYDINWRLRTASDHSAYTCDVDDEGHVDGEYGWGASAACSGIRPAINIHFGDLERAKFIEDYPTLEEDDAINFLRFIYNQSDDSKISASNLDIKNDFQYKILTGEIFNEDLPITDIQNLIADFCWLVEIIINRHIEDASEKSDVIESEFIEFLKNIFSPNGTSKELVLDEVISETAPGIHRIVGQPICDLVGVSLDIGALKGVITITDGVLNIVESIKNAIKFDSIAGSLGEASNTFSKYTYFNVSFKQSKNPFDDSIDEISFINISDGNPWAKFEDIYGKGAWPKLKEDIDRWADNLYQIYLQSQKSIHKYETMIDEPTCTEPGVKNVVCVYCDELKSTETINPKGHKYKKTVFKATCDKEGYDLYKCIDCDANFIENYTEKTEHKNYTKTYIPPTCTQYGYYTYVCECGEIWTEDYGTPKGHSYSKTIVEPTETEQGYTIYDCSECNSKYYDDYTNPTGHEFVVTVTKPTCQTVGFTTHTCSGCGYEYVDSYVDITEHSYQLLTDIKATCISEGKKEYSCKDCGATSIETVALKEHDYSYGTRIVEPTCTEPGYNINICVCGAENIGDYTDELGHDFSVVESVAASCKSDGFTKYECSVCNFTYSDVISKMEHNYETVETVTGNCFKSSYTLKKCTVCEGLKYENCIYADGHDVTDWETEKQATSTTKGLMKRYCVDCDYFETKEIPFKLYLKIPEPQNRTISYGESIKLYSNVPDLPAGYKVKWRADSDCVSLDVSSTGKTCTVTSISTGNVVVKAYIVDANGHIVTDENGKQISDSEYFYSEASLWLRIVYFFKKLFGISMNTVQLFKGVI